MNNKVQFNLIALLILICCSNCAPDKLIQDPIPTFDWSNKVTEISDADSLRHGTSYLSVYSQIYSYTEHISLDLTATVSIRNTSETDSIYLKKANYYDTAGNPIQSYLEAPIALKAMETLEIVIAEVDKKGGTGANFMFEWATKPNVSEPIFEAVMISTYGQQGLSFMTHGKRVD
jgi:hypothetical protein